MQRGNAAAVKAVVIWIRNPASLPTCWVPISRPCRDRGRASGDRPRGPSAPPRGAASVAGGVPLATDIMIRVPRRWAEGQVKKGKATTADNRVITARRQPTAGLVWWSRRKSHPCRTPETNVVSRANYP